jgi:hypothetical protein
MDQGEKETMTHTNGPWTLDWSDDRVFEIRSGDGDSAIRIIGATYNDALLLAATPDLLAALKALFDELYEHPYDIATTYAIDLEPARKAIAKATEPKK